MAELQQRKKEIPEVTQLCTHCFDPLLAHLGPSFYVPEHCKAGTCEGWWTHEYWEVKRSKCPCNAHSCETKKREMAEIGKRGIPPEERLMGMSFMGRPIWQ